MYVEMYPVAGMHSGRLSIMPRPRGGDWLEDEIRALRAAGVDVLVSLLTRAEIVELDLAEEENLCRAYGIDYHSLPITDRGLPPFNEATFRFLQALGEELAQGRHVAAHCRQGIGRASLVAASLLVGAGLPADEAFRRLEAARGRPVPDTDEQRQWVTAFEEHRQGWSRL